MRKALEPLPGVTDLTIDGKSASVSVDPKTFDKDVALTKLDELGFRPEIK